tara:strand:- start:94463 stop:95275 length:813 start_codon:yes stop_codon:yes gene_type:complete
MSKLKKLSNIIRLLLKKPYLLNLILEQNEAYEGILEKHNFSKGLPVTSFHELINDSKIQISPYAMAEGGSMVTDISLLKILAGQYKGNAVFFEIGTWRGETTANIASLVKECFTLNLSTEQLKAYGLPETYLKQQDLYSKNISNITHLKGDSTTFDFSPYYGKCDLVFVDGDHHFESVKKDTETAFKLLKNENSRIVWHDYAFHPGKIRNEVFAGILEGTPKEYHQNLYHVSNTMSAIFTRQPLPTTTMQQIIENKLYFHINISSNINQQ